MVRLINPNVVYTYLRSKNRALTPSVKTRAELIKPAEISTVMATLDCSHQAGKVPNLSVDCSRSLRGDVILT